MRSALDTFEIANEVVVAPVAVMFWKPLVPVKVFTFESNVEDAANSVMFAVPSNDTPLIVRAFWRAVAVPALPEIEPVMSEENVFEPLKVFALASSVEEAAVMVIAPPAFSVVPLMVPREPVR